MPEVTNTLVNAAGIPMVDAGVQVVLIGRWWADGNRATAGTWAGRTDNTGTWTVDLPPQSSYEGDTWYVVTESWHRYTITVPDGAGPHQVRDLLTTPVDPAIAAALALDGLVDVSTSGAVAGQVLTRLPDGSWGATSAAGVSDHGQLAGLADNDHPHYQLASAKGAPGGYPGLDESTRVPLGQLTIHAGSHGSGGSDPVTPAAIGAATPATLAAAVALHEGAADPHPEYLTPAEGNAAYAAAGHTHDYATRPVIRRAYIVDGSGATLPDTGGLWLPVPGFLLPIPAAVGDDLEIAVHAMRSATASALLDIGVVVGGSIVRYLATGGSSPAPEGDPGWYFSASFPAQSGPRDFVATVDDIAGGAVTFALVANAQGSGTVYASSDYPFYWRAINHGPG